MNNRNHVTKRNHRSPYVTSINDHDIIGRQSYSSDSTPRSHATRSTAGHPVMSSSPGRQSNPGSYTTPSMGGHPMMSSSPGRQSNPRSYTTPSTAGHPVMSSAPRGQSNSRSYASPSEGHPMSSIPGRPSFSGSYTPSEERFTSSIPGRQGNARARDYASPTDVYPMSSNPARPSYSQSYASSGEHLGPSAPMPILTAAVTATAIPKRDQRETAASGFSATTIATPKRPEWGSEMSALTLSSGIEDPHPRDAARSVSGATAKTSDFYDGNPWGEERVRDSQRNAYTPGARNSIDTNSRGYRDDNNPRASFTGRLTSLQGPLGTRGEDARRMDNDQLTQLLKEGYSTGLAHALFENATRYDFRFWVVDNSGSMQIGDGHRIVKKDGKSKAVACTRWEEIKETVKYHAQMATVLDCPTIFQLLNDPGLRTAPQRFSVCEHGLGNAHAEVAKSIDILRKVSPSGVTPLTQHIWDIEQHIAGMAGELRRSGKIVAIILATDGLPTDEQGYGGEDITDEFIRALRSLEGLPVWTVIRLCTDEYAVKQFYNSLDTQLEISIEVLDDYMGEAREVYKQNPWITYALPLHRCRELGYHDRLFDLIDERPLTPGEARSFCCLILRINEAEMVDPGEDASGFLKSLKTKLEHEQLQWNPMKKKMMPWILVKELKKSFSNRNCVIM